MKINSLFMFNLWLKKDSKEIKNNKFFNKRLKI